MLKDRGKIFKNELEESWYEQAYGKKRNLMKFNMSLPIPEGVKFATKLLYFAEITYTMFPEHVKEFPIDFETGKPVDAGKPKVIERELLEDEYQQNLFELEIELPFGTVSAELKYREEGAEDTNLHDITAPAVKAAFKTFCEPVPISLAD